ncbi:MAG: SDR family NAD(P)-dependent oxidoreductase [Hyphomicrobiaceae bacterium]
MHDRFKSRVAIVTGGGHGIGAAIASRLAAEGAKVLVCDIQADRAQAKAAEITTKNGTAAAFAVDVRERASVEAAVVRAVTEFGGLDVLINAAGVMDRAPFLETSDELWRKVLETNLTGIFLCCQTAARKMIELKNNGSIVNIASGSGILGGQGRAAYGASKAGVMNLTQTMAIELAAHGIRVNAVAPGPVKTRPEQGAALGPSVAARMPLKRFGTAEEIAALTLFLASGEASFITGHTYAADGGFTIAGILDG